MIDKKDLVISEIRRGSSHSGDYSGVRVYHKISGIYTQCTKHSRSHINLAEAIKELEIRFMESMMQGVV